ncbi:hypothetical protein [Paenibacillus terrae]|uniref:STAS/SEC14 domain-containing protein n=1 Tax=Paenibacillus terrae TaxID=159743 RepID=A0A0D7X3N6_9BACL|nr:hypothetical protein [Paenibacillus terrae]KJD45834.1 hypothetical protein QD47_09295 [Paenibacillus terrae]
MLYYESPEALVSWNQEIKTVVIEWKGFATRDEYQIPLNKSLELLIANKATKSIANTLKFSAISPADQQWFSEVWFPKAEEAGLKYMALITPEKAVARSILKRLDSELVGSYVTENFDSLEEAVRWLAQTK